MLDELVGRSALEREEFVADDGGEPAVGTRAASVLARHGVRPGDRVSLLVAPSVELLIATFAVWKAGGVPVVADASAGLVRLRRLVRGAPPPFIIGTPATLAAGRLTRFSPGARLAAFASLAGVADLRQSRAAATFTPVTPHADDVAAIVHTSGATGPAKPVRYTHAALAAQRHALAELWTIRAAESFTTSFGPFMLLAPALGMGFIRPDFDVNRPGELDFDVLASAVGRGDVTTAWLSPASAHAVAATAAGRRLPLRLAMLAGALIPRSLVSRIQEITGGEVRTPYGMTECLPVTDGTSPLATGALGGTSTGRPLTRCLVTVVPLDDPRGPSLDDGAWGEILVSTAWMFDGYDARWSADSATTIVRDGLRFHRTGDLGYLSGGSLFPLGRAQHVLRTAAGPFTSVAVEEPVADALERSVAAVAVGPPGAAIVALVIGDESDLRLAPDSLSRAARAVAAHQVAAVLLGPLPTDRRHQSKVDRSRLAETIARFLAGR